jgi:hypothetical protein
MLIIFHKEQEEMNLYKKKEKMFFTSGLLLHIKGFYTLAKNIYLLEMKEHLLSKYQKFTYSMLTRHLIFN